MSSVIDEAILGHVNWVMRFHHLVEGINSDAIDPKQIADDSICDLGRAMRTDPAMFESAEHLDCIDKLHKSFHEIAAEIVWLIQQPDSGSEARAKLAHLDDLSGKLINALHDAKHSRIRRS
jgi:hypothetical protein